MNFAKFLRTPFLTEHLRWLLLFKFTIINISTVPFLSLNSDFSIRIAMLSLIMIPLERLELHGEISYPVF